jgi:hypothetical protein
MPKIQYVPKKFNAAHETTVLNAIAICEEYEAKGHVLTLRQLYYQFVARGLIENTQRSYKNLGSIINHARLAGRVDWDHLQDRTRNVQQNAHWTSPEDIIEACARSYQIDKWAGQPHRVEVWIEKEALIGVIEGVCGRLDVPYFACKGYNSQSEMWSSGRRLKRAFEDGQLPVIIHLGDHDPSGMDMTRDIDDRLHMFSGGVEVKRVALNMPQIEEFQPPPNPAKITDSRAKSYIEEYGDESWELDALEPEYLEQLVEKSVLAFRDEDQWNEKVEEEEAEKAQLQKVSDNWDDVIAQEYLWGDSEE